MKYLAFILFFTLPLFSFSQSQDEMNKEAYEAYLAADKELNIAYNKLIALIDNNAKNILVKAQRNWIKFRDTHCEFEKNFYNGGSVQPLIYYSCLEYKTTERIKDLNASIQDYLR
jgi:uncharacterized protein YecT (DUF1311 family)